MAMSGTLKAVAVTEGGLSSENSCNLTISPKKKLPVFKSQLQPNISTEVGKEVSLEVEVMDQDDQIEVVWFKDDKKIMTSQNHYKITKDGRKFKMTVNEIKVK